MLQKYRLDNKCNVSSWMGFQTKRKGHCWSNHQESSGVNGWNSININSMISVLISLFQLMYHKYTVLQEHVLISRWCILLCLEVMMEYLQLTFKIVSHTMSICIWRSHKAKPIKCWQLGNLGILFLTTFLLNYFTIKSNKKKLNQNQVILLCRMKEWFTCYLWHPTFA